jgi:hypothetical protein
MNDFSFYPGEATTVRHRRQPPKIEPLPILLIFLVILRFLAGPVLSSKSTSRKPLNF